jgi:hypothetical protein
MSDGGQEAGGQEAGGQEAGGQEAGSGATGSGRGGGAGEDGRGSGGSGPDGGAGEDGHGFDGSAADPRPGESSASDSPGQEPMHGAYAVETPEQLLGEVASVRRRARLARHAYWFPLVLFGLITCASIPFYIQHIPTKSGVYTGGGATGPAFLRLSYLGSFAIFTGGYVAYYWLAAILVGVVATAAWYRWRGNRVGLRTPARGYLITGAVLLVLALGLPALAPRTPGLGILVQNDLLIRGTFPLVLIGICLCYLAWAERSVALTVIAAGYVALSLVASLYDIENILYRLGWNLSPAVSGLPNVVLPALVLLLSGASAWAVQRRYDVRPRSLTDAEAS